MELNKIYQGDCMVLMKNLPDGSVDMILCDLPYGVTNNKADKSLPLDMLWIEYKRVLKSDGVVVLTSQFPFTFDLIQSNRGWFRYDLVWDKVLPTGFLNANRQPLRSHEHILVFSPGQSKYKPQFSIGKQCHSQGNVKVNKNQNYGDYTPVDNSDLQKMRKYPNSILKFEKPHPSIAIHPTQKPLSLFRYLIKMYSDEGDLVLDNCVGSGTTAEAAKQLKRNFIGIEINSDYVDLANKKLCQEILAT